MHGTFDHRTFDHGTFDHGTFDHRTINRHGHLTADGGNDIWPQGTFDCRTLDCGHLTTIDSCVQKSCNQMSHMVVKCPRSNVTIPWSGQKSVVQCLVVRWFCGQMRCKPFFKLDFSKINYRPTWGISWRLEFYEQNIIIWITVYLGSDPFPKLFLHC